jgi:carbamoyl-phosphate synthase large subunit
MTDPEVADRTYIEPLTKAYVEEILRVETEMLKASGETGVFAVLPTVGGQTALNLAVDLSDSGVLDKFGVELIGAKLEAIKKAEDRLLFKDAMNKIGLDMPRSALVRTVSAGLEAELHAWRIGRWHRLQPRGDDGDPYARSRSLACGRVPY